MTAPLPVFDQRRHGVLLHPTALGAGQGALGAAARAFIDWLASAGASVWQMLPIGPVGPDGSPYWVRSDRAGNESLIDAGEAADPVARRGDYLQWCERERAWLDDYALFEALGAAHAGLAWWQWPGPLRERDAQALREATATHAGAIERTRIAQWQFDLQWRALRAYARERGVRLYGDLPIYLAPHSVATWTERPQFDLDGDGAPRALAGVPPDYFAADGQLWGNPLYDWATARADGYAFWRARLAAQLARFDLVRLDHFRGLAGFWAVPAGASTAREGEWRPGPGAALLDVLRAAAGGALPLVAEDLGLITPDVQALRTAFGLPGMRVLQFGFDGSPGNPHLPHNFDALSVAYTGTHDNDTTLGWYRSLDAHTAARVGDYLGCHAEDMPAALVRAALASVALLAVVPAQDLLALGSEARFNVPGTVGGNWKWRVPEGALTPELACAQREASWRYGRVAG